MGYRQFDECSGLPDVWAQSIAAWPLLVASEREQWSKKSRSSLSSETIDFPTAR
jgi:hypothetical protein